MPPCSTGQILDYCCPQGVATGRSGGVPAMTDTCTRDLSETSRGTATTAGPAFYPDLRRGRPIFLSGVECAATAELEAEGHDVGLLIQPDSHLEAKALGYRLWAADNGCFAKGASFDTDSWFSWVASLPGVTAARFGCAGAAYESRLMSPGTECPEASGCLFVVAPDVLGDAEATWRRSEPWFDLVRSLGFPVALVAQDGAESHAAMWDESERWDCLFLGGSTKWKLSEDARSCVHEAQVSAKWTHMGRVNSLRRLRTAAAWDLDSVDGTYLRFGPSANGRKLRGWLEHIDIEAGLPRLFRT
ncbi:MAG: hypothetical protein ACYCST_16980 [Acidimicrobiales bacterium]